MSDRFVTPAEILMISEHEYPLVVLSESLYRFVGWRIRKHTRSPWNHAMWLYRPGWLATQNWMYRAVPVERYLDGNYRLKLVYNARWTARDKLNLRRRIESELRGGIVRRHYDWLGTFIGQLTGLRWLQLPYAKYCSERVGDDLRTVEPEFDIAKPSPADINRWTKAHNPPWRVHSRFDPDVL